MMDAIRSYKMMKRIRTAVDGKELVDERTADGKTIDFGWFN